MDPISLSTGHSFAIERYEKRLRLIVYKNGEEYVCRKESRKLFNDFLNANEAKAFKGRLQLSKHNNDITVEVKGEVIGMVSAADMKNYLTMLF